MFVPPSESHTPRPGQRDLHHFAREIAGRMQHVLPGGRDASSRRVIVRSEMRPAATAAGGFHERQEVRRAAFVDHGLRGLDHQFVSLSMMREAERFFEIIANFRQRSDFFRHGDLCERNE